VAEPRIKVKNSKVSEEFLNSSVFSLFKSLNNRDKSITNMLRGNRYMLKSVSYRLYIIQIGMVMLHPPMKSSSLD